MLSKLHQAKTLMCFHFPLTFNGFSQGKKGLEKQQKTLTSIEVTQLSLPDRIIEMRNYIFTS